jgi:hypothetical protein
MRATCHDDGRLKRTREKKAKISSKVDASKASVSCFGRESQSRFLVVAVMLIQGALAADQRLHLHQHVAETTRVTERQDV